jgi:hypothetical protein
MCSGRLGPDWDRLTPRGIRDIMKGDWEYDVKPQFKTSKASAEYVISLPAELFGKKGKTSLDDTRRIPHIKDGRLHFLRWAFLPQSA